MDCLKTRRTTCFVLFAADLTFNSCGLTSFSISQPLPAVPSS